MTAYKIYSTPIPAGDSPRHEREQQAKQTLLAKTFGEDTILNHDSQGAPYIATLPETHISLSHCIDTCVLAVSGSPIGVDVETLRPQLAKVAHKFLTADESELFDRMTGDLGSKLLYLLKIWTAKEATFKAAKIPGLVLSDISITPQLTQAEARGIWFDISYPYMTDQKIIAVATPVATAE